MGQLTKERIEREWRVRLHFRTLRGPLSQSQTINPARALELAHDLLVPALPLFRQHGIHLVPQSYLAMDLPELADIDSNGTLIPTQEQLQLVAELQKDSAFPPNEIAVFLVSTIVVVAQSIIQGHALTVNGVPSVFISLLADRWTLAHELGHLLGLDHVSNDPSRLMYGDRIVAQPRPVLVWDELKKLRTSDLLHP